MEEFSVIDNRLGALTGVTPETRREEAEGWFEDRFQGVARSGLQKAA